MVPYKAVKSTRDFNQDTYAIIYIWGIQLVRTEMYKSIPIYIQQDVTLHSLFYLETALHVSGGTTTHNQERKQLYL